MMKTISALIFIFLFCFPNLSEAQKAYRIGALVPSDQFVIAFEGFKKKMVEIGYVEGKNIKYDFHNAKGDRDALQKMVQKLVQDKPDLIVTSATTATVPVAKATEGTDIPVVFLGVGNPERVIKSHKSSGNNLAGISASTIDLTEKRVELLKELVPGIKKVILLHNPKGVNYEANLNATREAARKLGLQPVEVYATSSDELIKRADELLNRKLGEGIVHPPDAIINTAIETITPHVNKEKLPSVSPIDTDVRKGSLASYAVDYFAIGQQGARLVDKILKGAKPADLPIEQPYKLRLVINLKTAKAIGLKIPKEILLRADEVIE